METVVPAHPASLSPAADVQSHAARSLSSVRWPAAAAALVAAAAHVPVTAQHLTEVPYIGWLFIALSLACTVGAFVLIATDAAVVWTGIGATCLAAVVGYVLSRGPGLPGMADDIGDWTNQLGVISVITETLVVVLAFVALSRRAGARSNRAIVAMGVGGLLLGGATYLLGLIAG